ncbi:MAG: PhzF family phenazine biosynthesis protein [Rhodothermales bacterium]|nr:PhzF family phenazine biosynthesis protein [Rhodothermales bacterium]
MSMTLYQVDSFTSKPFSGNPAGVCLLEGPADEHWMQNVALEMALSETAFLYPTGDSYNLRWFTPVAEVDLCGHATLAAAHILHELGTVDRGQSVSFETASGILNAEIVKDRIVLDFPPVPATDVTVSDELQRVAQTTIINAARNRLDYLIELGTQSDVEVFRADLNAIRGLGTRGLIVTAESSNPDYDFVSRYFAPAVGVDEDPVTGSTHCCLGPYWTSRLGKSTLHAAQLSRRGGQMTVHVTGSRVLLSGSAVTVMRLDLLE